MKQLTLQEQYNLIKEGKGHKDVFLKTAKSQFPNIVPNSATFEQTSALLKQRSVISEAIWGVTTGRTTQPDWFSIFNENVNENYVASSQEEPVKNSDKKVSKEVEEDQESNFDYKDPKNRDNVYGQEFLTGYYAEMKDPKNSEKTVDELLELVSKNLAKDRLYYVKDGQFGVKGLGYTEDAPGLGAGKEAKGKYKSSGYGDLKENKKLKEYSVYQGDVSKIKPEPTPKDGEVYLKNLKAGDKFSISNPDIEYIIVKPETNSSGVEVTYADGTGNMRLKGSAVVKLKEIGMFNDPIGYKKSEPNPKDEIFTKKFVDTSDTPGVYIYDIYKNGVKVKTIEGEGNANAWINDEMRKLEENKNNMIKLVDLLEGEYYEMPKKEKKVKEEIKKKVKKSPISDRVKEIEEESMFNAMEGKIQAMAEEIEMRENKLAMIDENEDLQEFINPVRIKEMQKEIDELKKTKLKMENEYEKKSKGRKPKEIIDETEEIEEEVNEGLGSYENFEKAWKNSLRKGM